MVPGAMTMSIIPLSLVEQQSILVLSREQQQRVFVSGGGVSALRSF